MKKLLTLVLTLLLVSLFTVYACAETENVAIGASYEVLGILTDGEGKTHYPDETGDSLTNNVFAQSASYSDIEFVGLNITSEGTSANNGVSEIALDLGEVYPIVNAAVSCSNLNSAGISLPGMVTVVYSVDGENWSEPVSAEYVFRRNRLGPVFAVNRIDHGDHTGKGYTCGIKVTAGYCRINDRIYLAQIECDFGNTVVCRSSFGGNVKTDKLNIGIACGLSKYVVGKGIAGLIGIMGFSFTVGQNTQHLVRSADSYVFRFRTGIHRKERNEQKG